MKPIQCMACGPEPLIMIAHGNFKLQRYKAAEEENTGQVNTAVSKYELLITNNNNVYIEINTY